MIYVYKHTFPNNKVYIGITREKPIERWQRGLGYKDNTLMYEDILKYGWDNIKHEILLRCRSINKAEEIERLLILAYQSEVPEYGYNRTKFRQHLLNIEPIDTITTNTTQKINNVVKKPPTDPNYRRIKQSKPVICVNTGEVFNSIKEASIAKNINVTYLGQYLKGTYISKSHLGGYEWEYYIK